MLFIFKLFSDCHHKPKTVMVIGIGIKVKSSIAVIIKQRFKDLIQTVSILSHTQVPYKFPVLLNSIRLRVNTTLSSEFFEVCTCIKGDSDFCCACQSHEKHFVHDFVHVYNNFTKFEPNWIRMYWENTSFIWTFLCHCHSESRSISSKCHKSVNLNTGNQVITKFQVYSKQTIRKKPRRFLSWLDAYLLAMLTRYT